MHQAPRSVLLVLAAVAVSSCDEPAVSSSIARLGPSPAAVVNVTGTWAGAATDSTGQVQVVWQLTQNGRNVTGTIAATTHVGLDVYRGTVAGSLAADVLTFTATVPGGGILELPDCAITLSGSFTDLQADSMAGTYTGSHSCFGAIEGGRLMLVRE